ncbi:MAG TPA: hemolysin III family protein [Thermoanaerobaculia bacterium]|nr:hemolysin III family protein [Thermoanaerobaculia bacterium]
MVRGERFNSITHLVGTVLALIATAVVVTLASLRADARAVTAVAIYGTMLVVLYLSSTLYHSLRGKAKNVFRVFDHTSIYLLIAGTYTPFTLVTLRGPLGWTLFGIVWTLAILGVTKDAVFHGRFRGVSVTLYVMMGWLIVLAFVPLRRALPPAGIAWLVAGGIVYTVGIVFYALGKRVAFTHGVWHLFVIGGSVCHYVAVLRYVALYTP